MKIIPRDRFLKQLIDSKSNGMIKTITGVKGCGKTFLLFTLFKNHLLNENIPEERIISVNLDDCENKELRDPHNLYYHIKERITEKSEEYYILIDEILHVSDFESVLNGLNHISNANIYVTGSNSKYLSADIITEFRGRTWNIHITPLTFSEYISVYDGNEDKAWKDYVKYGGMPESVFLSDSDKESYLKNLIKTEYLSDITEKKGIRHPKYLEYLVEILCSCSGSLVNASRIADEIHSSYGIKIDSKTVHNHLDFLNDAFIFQKIRKYDIKRGRCSNSIVKYYSPDVGLKNACSGFEKLNHAQILENIIFNELIARGHTPNVGIIPVRTMKDGVSEFRQMEIDFVVDIGSQRVYIQTVDSIFDREQHKREIVPFTKINDSFKKIVVVKDNIRPWFDDYGILIVGIREFLLNESLMYML